jgi:hypothetical protein
MLEKSASSPLTLFLTRTDHGGRRPERAARGAEHDATRRTTVYHYSLVLPADCANAAVTIPELDETIDDAVPDTDPVCVPLVDTEPDEDDAVDPADAVGPQLPNSVCVGTVATTRLLEVVLYADQVVVGCPKDVEREVMVV